MIARPSVEEERWLILADRYPALRTAAEQLGGGGRWKSATPLGRLLGVLLALLGIGMLGGILFAIPAPLLVGGALLMVVAEWMVAQRRVYRSGVEEVLYLCGVVGVVMQFLVWSDDRSMALGMGLVATAVLLVGWRLLNPVFTTLALAGYSLAIALVNENFLNGSWNMRSAAAFCAVAACGGLIGGARQRRRPSHDHMCDGLSIVMPWLCCAWLLADGWGSKAQNYLALAAALGFCMVWLFVGVRRRCHAPLIGALGSLAGAAYSLHLVLRWPLHRELIAAGGLLLIAAIVIERRLRGRTAGLTASKLDEPAGIDLVQLAGAAHLTPAPGAAPPEPMQGQGGSFGGGGASGRF